MKQFFKKPLVIVSLVAVVLLVAWYMYDRRSIKFSDNAHAGTISRRNGGADIGGGLALIGNSNHGLKVGDTVEVTQDEGYKYPEYNGEAIVTHIVTPKIFAVNKAFAGNSPVNGGTFKKIKRG